MQLRYAYLLYQQTLQQSAPVNHAVHRQCVLQYRAECLESLHAVLDALHPTAAINNMVSCRQNVILTDNQPICVNQGTLGVILPFYGSSSFITIDSLEEQNKTDVSPSAVAQLAGRLKALSKKKEEEEASLREVVDACEKMKEKPEWLLYLRFGCVPVLIVVSTWSSSPRW